MYTLCIFTQATARPAAHVKSMKIGFALFLVFTVSVIPTMYGLNFGGPINGYLMYAYSINNLANFFIYLAVDEEFRAKLKAICARKSQAIIM